MISIAITRGLDILVKGIMMKAGRKFQSPFNELRADLKDRRDRFKRQNSQQIEEGRTSIEGWHRGYFDALDSLHITATKIKKKWRENGNSSG